MFRKTVNPRIAAITTIVTLLAIQWFYWRFLVYVPPTVNTGAQGNPGGPAEELSLLGLDSVRVENWIGDEPGLRDGKSWEARFSGPNALAFLPNGHLAVSDSRNHRIRRVTPTGVVTTIAGGGSGDTGGNKLGPAAQSALRYPSGVAAAPDGAVYIADTGNNRVCVLKDGTLTLLAGGQIGSVDGQGPAARFNGPGPCAVDRAGLLWVVDAGNRKLRAVTKAGKVTSPTLVPREIQGALGEILTPKPVHIWGSRDGETAPTWSRHLTRRIGAAGWAGTTRVYGDLVRNVILAQPPGREPFMLAGRINPSGDVLGDKEGPGFRSSFATPAAVIAGPTGALYVADYDGNRLRRLHVPPELLR